MQPKGDTSSGDTGHSPCVIRAGFYAENLLLYSKQAQGEGKLPLPIGEEHKFAPIALGDVAQIAAYVITSEGPHGLADNVRGQVIVATGDYMLLYACMWPGLTFVCRTPTYCWPGARGCGFAGGVSTKMDFESISEYASPPRLPCGSCH